MENMIIVVEVGYCSFEFSEEEITEAIAFAKLALKHSQPDPDGDKNKIKITFEKNPV